MAPLPATVEGNPPAAGDHCPRCGYGVLVLIGENAEGVTLRCFMCDTQGSVHKSEPFVESVDAEHPGLTPTGFTVSHAQKAAAESADPEQARDRSERGQTAAGDKTKGS